MMTERKKQTTEQRIIEAAVVLFHENGFDETTVKEITDRANVAKGTFFHYFPTKESIMTALIQERVTAAIAFVQSEECHQLTFNERLEAYFHFLLSDYDVNPQFSAKSFIHLIETENTLLNHWKILLSEAKRTNELDSNVNILECSHIMNSQFYYALMMFSKRGYAKQTFIDVIMKLINICIYGIIGQRGNQRMEKLVLLGGGYGNMRILQRILNQELPPHVEVILIDRLPYHCLKTEYYALAAGTQSDLHLRVQFPTHPQLTIKFANVKEVDHENKMIYFDKEDPLPYDTLVIGLGCEDNFHGVPGAEEHTLSIQTMELTRSTYETLSNLKPNGVVSIVGAGLSGVELASELRESRSDLTIKLFDRGDIILSAFPKRLSQYVQNWFLEHGVEVINNSNITKVETDAIYNHDERIESDVIIWTAGTQPSRVVRNMDIEKDQHGRAALTPRHHIPIDENVFVVGDCASLPYPPSAQLAEGQAEQIVTVLKKRWKNEPVPETFPSIKLKGVLGSLGKKHGFGMMGERAIMGRVPRMIKSGVLWMSKHNI